MAQAEENRLLSLAATTLGEDRLAESFQLRAERYVAFLSASQRARPVFASPDSRSVEFQQHELLRGTRLLGRADVDRNHLVQLDAVHQSTARALGRALRIDLNRGNSSNPVTRAMCNIAVPIDRQTTGWGRPARSSPYGRAVQALISSSDSPETESVATAPRAASAHGPRCHTHPDRLATSKPPAVISVPVDVTSSQPARDATRSRPRPAAALRAEHLQEVCGLCWLPPNRGRAGVGGRGGLGEFHLEEVEVEPDSEKLDRPDRVIILDADNPMTEIRGRFVWVEEHARVVEAARRAAYAEGFADGCALVANSRRAARRPRTLRSRARRAFVFGLLVLTVLMLPVILL